ncbi:MAG: hypothetical protein R6W83_09635 [Cryobacterium sp.]
MHDPVGSSCECLTTGFNGKRTALPEPREVFALASVNEFRVVLNVSAEYAGNDTVAGSSSNVERLRAAR